MRAYGLFWKTYFFGSFLIPASPVNPHLFITTVFFKALISPAMKLGGKGLWNGSNYYQILLEIFA